MFDGQVIEGFSLSTTDTVKLHSALFPEGSVASKVTVVIPTGNKLPDAGPLFKVTVAVPVLSVAVGVAKFTIEPQTPGSTFRVIAEGQVITGGSVSALAVIVTVKLHSAVFPEASVTTKVLVVIPNGKVAPDANPAVCAIVEPEQLSLKTGKE